MKRITARIVAILLMVTWLTGCGTTVETPPAITATTAAATEITTTTASAKTTTVSSATEATPFTTVIATTAATTETTTTFAATVPLATSTTTATTIAPTTAMVTTTTVPTVAPTASTLTAVTTLLPTTDPATAAASVTTETTTTVPTTTTTTVPPVMTLGGVRVSEYVVVYDDEASDYTLRAATYIRDEIFARTGERLNLMKDSESAPTPYEILVGDTDRPLSGTLTAPTDGLEFALQAGGGHVALEADQFVIAAAAYYFVETYITDKPENKIVPTEKTVCSPIVKTPKNFMILIGDGMGVAQTKLFDVYRTAGIPYSDNESAFYGYKFPAQGFARTNSLDGVTDSAAAGTALATGYKTLNGRIGKDADKKDLLSLTELAGSRGMATAVLSTEGPLGATPAAFTVHTDGRIQSGRIEWLQEKLQNAYGTILGGPYNYTNANDMRLLEMAIEMTLKNLDANEKGFFMMYEEAYVDKHCHSNKAQDAFRAVVRFNQAIGRFMEYAFYHPDTFVLITADHETGGLTLEEDGTVSFSTENHTGADVPVFAYGKGSEVFRGKTVENVQIPKTIAKWMGESLATETDATYPPLN